MCCKVVRQLVRLFKEIVEFLGGGASLEVEPETL